MFRKIPKVKSKTQLKSSERKKFLQKVKSIFTLTDEDLLTTFPAKEPVCLMKLNTFSQDVVNVYLGGPQLTPLFFEVDDKMFPTVFFLWQCPHAIPYVRVFSGVTPHLFGGSDLMAPGIVRGQSHFKELNFAAGTTVYINTEQNNAAVFVGKSLLGGVDLFSCSKGKAVEIYHWFGDKLCEMFEAAPKSIPNMGISSCAPEEMPEEKLPVNEEEVTNTIENLALASDSGEQCAQEQEITMDELLLYCFAKSVKNSSSKLQLPILTNIFYKNFMLETVPKNMNLDLKKTTYKKLSVFLNKMAELNAISIETEKGVQSITDVNFKHEVFVNFIDKLKDEEEEQVEEDSKSCWTFSQKNIVNGQISQLFSKYKVRKGDALTDQEVRQLLTQYIKDENIQNPQDKERINLNGPLCDVLQTKDLHSTWKKIFDNFTGRMGKCYEIHTPNNEILTGKGKIPPIEIIVQTKTANKKVTVVKNLDLYGINVNTFSKECQLGVAASSTINSVPSSKCMQFQIQGNQKKFIGNLLLEKYLIPKKYITGLEEQKKKK